MSLILDEGNFKHAFVVKNKGGRDCCVFSFLSTLIDGMHMADAYHSEALDRRY